MNLFRALLWIFGIILALLSFLIGIIALEELRYDEIPSARVMLKFLQFFAIGSITLIGLAVEL